MPKISKVYQLEITLERFLNECSAEELREVELLLQRPMYQHKMNESDFPELPGNS